MVPGLTWLGEGSIPSFVPTLKLKIMDNLERRSLLNRLTKGALVDLVLISLRPEFNRGLTLDKLLYESLLQQKIEEIDKTMKNIASLNREASGYRTVWLELNEKLNKLWVEHEILMNKCYLIKLES